MEAEYITRAILSLVFVAALIGIIAFIFQKLAIEKNLLNKGQAKRLKIQEYLILDSKRKLALVKKDEEEILILLGSGTETIINTSKTKKK